MARNTPPGPLRDKLLVSPRCLRYLRNLLHYRPGAYPKTTMTPLSWRKSTSFLLLCALFAAAPAFVHSQDSTEGTRKVLTKVTPKYPAIARKMNITGIVRIEALVALNGTVKGVSVKGGHPLLAQAAQDSIREWKWEPSSHETHELIEVKFENPN